MLARILVLWLAAAVMLAAQPNIILIVSDDQGCPDLGCIGLKPLLTPNLDKRAYGPAEPGET